MLADKHSKWEAMTILRCFKPIRTHIKIIAALKNFIFCFLNVYQLESEASGVKTCWVLMLFPLRGYPQSAASRNTFKL